MADNYGFGSYGVSGELVTPATVKPATGIPSLIPKMQGNETKGRDILKGSLFGAIAPFLGEVGVASLAKVLPEEWLYKDVATGIEALDPESPQYRTYLATLPLPERWNIEQARRKVEQALPRGKKPKEKTLFGKGVEQALTFGPAFLLEEDEGGPEAFIKTAQASRKAQTDIKAAQRLAYSEREEARGEKILEEQKTLERVVFNGSKIDQNGTPRRISRQGVVSQDGQQRFVRSQGDPVIDVTSRWNPKTEKFEEIKIPKGQFYYNPTLTASFREGELGKVEYDVFINTEGDESPRLFQIHDMIGPQGTRETQYMTRIDGVMVDRKELPGNWIPYDSNVWKPRELPSVANKDLTTYFTKRELAEAMLLNAAQLQHRVNVIAEANPSATSFAGNFSSAMANIMSDIDGFMTIFGDDGYEGFRDSLQQTFTIREEGDDTDKGFRALELQGRLQNYLNLYHDKEASEEAKEDARNSFLRATDALRKSANDSNEGIPGYGADLSAFLKNEKILETSADQTLILATQLQLAYMAAAAAGQTGRTLSDKDLANFLQVIGYGETRVPSEVQQLGTTFIYARLSALDGAENQTLNDLAQSKYTAKDDAMRTYLAATFNIPREIQDRAKEGNEEARNLIMDKISRATNNQANNFLKWDDTLKRITYTPAALRFADQFQMAPFFGEYVAGGEKGWFKKFNLTPGAAWTKTKQREEVEKDASVEEENRRAIRKDRPSGREDF